MADAAAPAPDYPDHRVDPAFIDDERTMLVGFLEWYRQTLERKTFGLTDTQAATASVPPSIMTMTGLVRHMAEVERNWFRRCFNADDAKPIFYDAEHPDGDLEVDATTSLADSLTVWRREVDIAQQITEHAVDMDQVSLGLRAGEHVSLRWILIHMIEEYARHCGHADLIRERIDGFVGD